jgi:hypothetical protein
MGRRAAGMDFTGVTSEAMEAMLRAGLGLSGMNMGSIGGAIQKGRLDDLVYEDELRNLQDKNFDMQNFDDLYRNSRYRQTMTRFGGR